ncbi:hypothetical protein [Chryseobacterium pennipullorum]|uniref:Uncharacterized protein n=1 Tax=Chryseobacterium pennipullorum TaxID=2258963 RepID=A0A3D9AS64_9FLAO|nr:hypothetical protein [Chryseobacterium pennipullorum]REC44231.1 hypothetical protein DRF67_18050 [Chryseobacterium pennipullorum]
MKSLFLLPLFRDNLVVNCIKDRQSAEVAPTDPFNTGNNTVCDTAQIVMTLADQIPCTGRTAYDADSIKDSK